MKCSPENIGEVVKESRLSEKLEGSHVIVKYLDGNFKLGWTKGPDREGDVCKGERKGRPKKESLVISEFYFGVKKEAKMAQYHEFLKYFVKKYCFGTI